MRILRNITAATAAVATLLAVGGTPQSATPQSTATVRPDTPASARRDSVAPTDSYLQLADSADHYINRQMWPEAEAVLVRNLRRHPANVNNWQLLSNLGVARTHLRKLPEAMEAFETALVMRPQSAAVRNNRAFAWLVADNTEEALKDLKASLEIDSVQEWPLRMKGLIELKENRTEEARQDMERHRRHFDPTPEVLSGLALCAEAEGRKEEAIGLYEEALGLRQDPDNWFRLIMLKIESNRLGEADDDLLRALKIYPDEGNLYLLRAVLRKQNFLNTEAEADLKLALRKGADPELAKALLGSATPK